MARLISSFFAIIILIIAFIPMFLIYIAILTTSKGSPIYWSKRVGKNNKTFQMPKFRSMMKNTPQVATHLLRDQNLFLTPIGSFLRRTSLDELPQLISIIKGDMGFVGPRPALFNQTDLIKLRTDVGLHKLVPGITGLAQINGRDELLISEKVELDQEYMKRKSLWVDFKIIFITFIKVIKKEGVAR